MLLCSLDLRVEGRGADDIIISLILQVRPI